MEVEVGWWRWSEAKHSSAMAPPSLMAGATASVRGEVDSEEIRGEETSR